MQRREFSQAAAAMAVLGYQGAVAQAQGAATSGARARGIAMGTNLSGMEWAKPGLRRGLSSEPNIHYTVPRKADVAYLADCGFTKNRLPIQWELLQPMLHDTVANDTAKSLIGQPGDFHTGYAGYITGVLDAHAAAGIRCIIDLHNYCRYQDFRYQPDGSVIGLTRPPIRMLRPYTRDASQIQERIFSLAEGATLTQAHFVDFWKRAATLWKSHPGFGGYGLMNEPHEMPKPGTLTGAKSGEDLAIWPAYAQAAIRAIRIIDDTHPIYVGGNEWSSAMAMGSKNPGFPLAGSGLIYEVHLYLDAYSNGAHFDYDTEAAKHSPRAAFGGKAIHDETGYDRLRLATEWAKDKKVKLALTEIGMPIDDARWPPMFRRTVDHALQNGCEVYSWMGGNHWPIRNFPINHVPGWHQDKTLEPLVSGVMKASASLDKAMLFDDGPAHAPAGLPVTITVYARGNLARPVSLAVAVKGTGKLSKSKLLIPAGPNGQDSFVYTAAPNEVASLRYSRDGQPAGQVPPPRQVFSLSDPLAHAGASLGNLGEAALALMAKYQASKWDMADGYTDYVLGAPALDGQPVRAVADSGYGSAPGNAMEMLNFFNTDSRAMGSITLPVMRISKGRGQKSSEHGGAGCFGLWCKKSVPQAGVQANPVNRMPYNLEDAHFVIAAVSLTTPDSSGLVFQASKAEEAHASELGFVNGQPTARWLDAKGRKVELTGTDPLAPGKPAVLTLTSAPREQALRVDSEKVAGASATFAPGAFGQMLIGWGFVSYYPRDGFSGNIHAVITGKGLPSTAELKVMEAYLARLMAGNRLS
ncbi:MAG: Twin-arginine translocation pathway signal [Polaromonas sp.]|nr:Twin-arginine translocation pathway signal [Polaromonas sp.]